MCHKFIYIIYSNDVDNIRKSSQIYCCMAAHMRWIKILVKYLVKLYRNKE